VRNPNPASRRPGGAPKDLRILCETIQRRSEFTFVLKLDAESKLTPESLLSAVGDFYKAVAKSDRISGDNLELPDTGLVRLGSGSGAYSTSLLLFVEETGPAGLRWGRDGYRVKPPKSRKRAGGGDIPMGWAKMGTEG